MENKKKRVTTMLKEGEKVTPNIVLCADNKYRWIYYFNLFRNFTILFLIWRIFLYILLAAFLTYFLSSLSTPDFFMEGFYKFLKIFAIALGVMTALVVLGYLIYAGTMGGKYIVLFEMDENGVVHKQIPSQAKKAKNIAKAGLTTSRITIIGATASAARTSMYSDFKKVVKVKYRPHLNTIKVNQKLSRNEIYAEKEDYEFVKEYIVNHCPNIKK